MHNKIKVIYSWLSVEVFPDCSAPFTKVEFTAVGITYKYCVNLVKTPVDRCKAEAECLKMGAYLALLEGFPDKQNLAVFQSMISYITRFCFSILVDDNTHVGLRAYYRGGSEFQRRWNGTSLPAEHPAWATGEPDFGGLNPYCTKIVSTPTNSGNGFRDNPCENQPWSYMCERTVNW